MRTIRANMDTLIDDESIAKEIATMRLGVSHAIGRYKVKFNLEKIDTMIVQVFNLIFLSKIFENKSVRFNTIE